MKDTPLFLDKLVKKYNYCDSLLTTRGVLTRSYKKSIERAKCIFNATKIEESSNKCREHGI